MSSDKSILVPVNFEEQSIIALKQSYKIAKLKEAKLVLLFVDKETDEGYLQLDKQKLEDLAEEVRTESGLKVETLLVKGKPFDEIIHAANKIKPLFIVMGYQGAINVTTFMGHNPFYVVRHAPCPVITVKGKKHYDGCRKIVLPIDLSKETREKVGRGIEMAKLFGATLDLVLVQESSAPEDHNKLIAYGKQVISFIKKEGITCEFEIVEDSNVTNAVLAHARKVGADLICIMTQQEMKLTDYVMGTRAMKIINNSEIPVMSIRPMDRKDTTVVGM